MCWFTMAPLFVGYLWLRTLHWLVVGLWERRIGPWLVFAYLARHLMRIGIGP